MSENIPEGLQHKNFTDYNITSDDLDKIHFIASKAGWDVLFGLNVCLRSKDDTWNYTNPLKILEYVASKSYKFGWELGNGKVYNVTYKIRKTRKTKNCV
jgi:hypothetical protein